MPAALVPDPEGSALGAELHQDLADAIGALPPRLALVVVAHILDGRELKSIAADFGVTPSRVSQLCGEALGLLRSALDDADGATPERAVPHQHRTTYLAAVGASRRRRRLEGRARVALHRAS